MYVSHGANEAYFKESTMFDRDRNNNRWFWCRQRFQECHS